MREGERNASDCMEGADLISNLPDTIVAAIVSLLSGTEGVRTSILSQRWKTVWKYTSHLSFDQRQMLKPLTEHYLRTTNPNIRIIAALRRKVVPKDKKVVDAIAEAAMLINSVIDSHYGPLKTCNIRHLAESCVSGEAVGWMRKLLEKGVRKVSMELEPPDYTNPHHQQVKLGLKKLGWILDLPFKVFSSFEVLELKNYHLNTSPSCDPPQILKTLTFNRVHIEPNHFQKIISRCSSLENLTLEECDSLKVVKIDSPYLKYFKIFKMLVHEIVVSAINIEVIEIDTVICDHQRLAFQTPKLQVLRCYSDLKKIGRCFRLSGNELLTTKDIIEFGSGILSPRGSSIASTFQNLVTLCIDFDFKIVKNVIALSFALKSCNQLKNLEINNQVNDESWGYYGGVYDQNEDDYLPFPKHLFWQSRELCECVSHQLKTLCIRGYTSKEFEVEFVKYIITNAGMMERITIWFVDNCSWVEATATLCLLSFPKASAKLSITLKPGPEYMREVGVNFEMWVSTLRL